MSASGYSGYGGSNSSLYSNVDSILGSFNSASSGNILGGGGNYNPLFGGSSLSGASYGGNAFFPQSGSSQTLVGKPAATGGISSSTTILIFMGVAVLGALVASGVER